MRLQKVAGEVGEEGEEKARYIKCPISFMRVDCKRKGGGVS